MDLVQAVTEGNTQQVLSLLQSGEDPNQLNYIYQKSEPIIFEATRDSAKFDILEILLFYGADANRRNRNGQTPLFFAQNIATIDLFMSHGAQLNVVGYVDGQSTILENPFDLSCAQHLVSIGANVNLKNAKNQTCIFNVGNSDIFLYYRDVAGVDYNYLDDTGGSLVHSHVKNSNLDIIPYLINMNMDLNLADASGKKPLFYSYNTTIIGLMYAHGARF